MSIRTNVRVAVQLFSHFCTDHEALAGFYIEAFGLSPVAEVGSPIFIALDAGNVALGFHAADAYDLLGIADRKGGVTANHVTFDLGTVAAVDAAVDELIALGATLIQGPFTTYYGARQTVLADPEGNVFRISDTQPALTFGS